MANRSSATATRPSRGASMRLSRRTRAPTWSGPLSASRGPAGELRYRITQSIKFSNAGLPSLNELSTPQEFPMVESWRQVAKAAVLGEHDFGGLMDDGRMSASQCRTVLKDAAEVTRALVVLDKRYENIPGWIPIRERGRLDRAAQVCAVFAGYDEPDYSVDQKGWRPPPATIDGGPLPGIGGVLQAEHNMLVHLAQLPERAEPAPRDGRPANPVARGRPSRTQRRARPDREVARPGADLQEADRRDPRRRRPRRGRRAGGRGSRQRSRPSPSRPRRRDHQRPNRSGTWTSSSPAPMPGSPRSSSRASPTGSTSSA